MALTKANIKEEESNDIHYNYAPIPLDANDINIILFKANKITNKINISRYFVENATYNHIDSYLKSRSNLRVISLDSDHLDWTDNSNEISKMCNTVLRYFYS